MYRRTQEDLNKEYEIHSAAEWIERREGQSDAIMHGDYMHSYIAVALIHCVHCGRAFYCDNSSYHKGLKYCSYRCTNDAYFARRKEWRREEREGMICRRCGRAFSPKRKDAVYCCAACKQAAYRDNKRTAPSSIEYTKN